MTFLEIFVSLAFFVFLFVVWGLLRFSDTYGWDENTPFFLMSGQEMLEAIRETLKARAEGNNLGGDVEIMHYVDLIVQREKSL